LRKSISEAFHIAVFANDKNVNSIYRIVHILNAKIVMKKFRISIGMESFNQKIGLTCHMGCHKRFNGIFIGTCHATLYYRW
jgi:hypothetical protein